MSYLRLLLLCLLPPIVLLAVRARTRNTSPDVPSRHQCAALAVLVVLAALATLPWDAALIARGTWSYPAARPVGWVAGVPVEELLFMVLQPVLVGLWLRTLPGQRHAPMTLTARNSGHTRRLSARFWLILAVAGVLLTTTPRGAYLGWLLAWAGPLLASQWAVAGDVLWARRRQLLAATAVPVLYLCAVDRLALHLRLWALAPARTTGLDVLGLPLEEALFFLLTTVLVTGGLLLATDPATLRRLTSWPSAWLRGHGASPAQAAHQEVMIRELRAGEQGEAVLRQLGEVEPVAASVAGLRMPVQVSPTFTARAPAAPCTCRSSATPCDGSEVQMPTSGRSAASRHASAVAATADVPLSGLAFDAGAATLAPLAHELPALPGARPDTPAGAAALAGLQRTRMARRVPDADRLVVRVTVVASLVVKGR